MIVVAVVVVVIVCQGSGGARGTWHNKTWFKGRHG